MKTESIQKERTMTQTTIRNFKKLPQSTAASTWWCGPRPRLGWVEMAVGLPEGPSYPGHSPSFFRFAAPWTTAEGQHTASSKSVACFLFIFSPALLLPVFVSLFFSFSWWAATFIQTLAPFYLLCVRRKCDQAGQVSAMLHLLQMGPSKVLTTSPLQIQNFWQLSPLELPPCCVSTRNTVTLSSDSSDIYTSTVQSSPSSANAALPPHPRLQTSYIPSAHFISSLFAPSPPSLDPGCPSAPPASSPPLTLSGFFNGMLEVFESGALNYSTFSRFILSTLSASRNPILTHLSLSRFLYSLLCVLIVPTPYLAFSLLMPRTLLAVSSFSSGRAYPFQNFLPPLFLRLIHTLIT